MNLSNKELFIFDLDGTLIDSVPDITLGVNDTLTELSLPNFNEDKIRAWVGNGAEKLMERALEAAFKEKGEEKALDFSDVMTVYLKNYKNNLTINTYAYKGVIDTLNLLRERNIKMAIVTNKPFDFIEPLLEFIGIKQFFSLWIGADSLPTKKPNPEPLLHVCEELNVLPEKAIMVGDSKNDILAAQNAKMNSIGLTYGYNYNEPISVYHPDIVLDNLFDVANYF
ncbi:phosphoglycolate phosphatase [Weeksellaceae bacterium TAE3-ERU29]|nr:phosphoglycolate phosphatase [Weeksellaceae bacterium TAE3-ERU29]